jgi:hypothetical protein
MGWMYVTYTEEGEVLPLGIEPMAAGADVVYVPDDETWGRNAPGWAVSRRTEILSRLKSVAWGRRVDWREGRHGFTRLAPGAAVRGSLESTPLGRVLEWLRLFGPGGGFSHEEAHRWYHAAVRKYCEEPRGPVAIRVPEVIPGSVFQEVALPTLKANRRVTLTFQ